MGSLACLFGHERPLEPGREPGAATSAQPRVLDLVDDGIAAFLQDRPRAIPGAARTRAGQAPVAAAIEIAKDAVLVIKHRLRLAGLPPPYLPPFPILPFLRLRSRVREGGRGRWEGRQSGVAVERGGELPPVLRAGLWGGAAGEG